MNTNKINFWGSVIIICLIIIIPTSYKVLTEHKKNLILVTELKIIESYKKCYYDNECGESVTLKDLYVKKYLDTQTNPITREVYNSESNVIYKDGEFKFIPKE